MIKIILALVLVQGILGAPANVPFDDYVGPLTGDENNHEHLLPGTRNHEERSQVRVDLPGTRNLDEKSIPDTITLKKIPIPSSELEDEIPKYIFDGSFESVLSSVAVPQTESRFGDETEVESVASYPAAVQVEEIDNTPAVEPVAEVKEEQSYYYPAPQSEETATQAPAKESAYYYDVPASKVDVIVPSSTASPAQETAGAYFYYPPATKVVETVPEIKDERITPRPTVAPAEQPDEKPYYYPVPEVGREETGSDIRDTESFPEVQNTPLQLPLSEGPNPNEFNEGEEIRDAFVSTNPLTPSTSGDNNQFNIPPSSSIKVQDNRGQYAHGFSNPDGTQVQESGRLITTDNGWEYVIAKEGSYSYPSPEGIPIHVRYIADEKGFRILSQNFAGR